jgi:hypothetical protein
MDMWEPKTLKRLQARAGGSSKSTEPDVHIPARDAERHATQAQLAQQQGGVRKEPVILIKTSNGYELLEGWHRTIQHFHKFPDGYTGPAYVAVAQGQQGVAEGDVVPFKQPSKTLTWDQVPRDVLLLANDWFWASEDNSGLDATIDPEGFGNGTANDVKYNAAKLQQKGWTIDFNDEYDAPRGPFHLRLTNKRGQTVLLPIEDAQDFTGWAEGTSSLNEGPFVQRITHPKKVSIYLRIGKGSRLVATDIPYEILDKYVAKVIQKYPQFKSTDFSFASTDKVDEVDTNQDYLEEN